MSTSIQKMPSLLSTFEGLPNATKQTLADINSPLLLGLATLLIAKEHASRPFLSAEHIVAALEAAGVAIEKTQISKAFSRAGDRVSRKIVEDEIHYIIMTKGEREVVDLLQKGEISVSFIEAGKPRSARRTLAELFSSLTGDIKICDPYYGLRTLDALELIPSTCNVQFLSAQTTEKPTSLSGPLADFKRERPKTEMRIYPNPKIIHDRYLISNDGLFLLGHGIKDIGNKESFIVNISKDYAGDLLTELLKSFDDKWLISTPLK